MMAATPKEGLAEQIRGDFENHISLIDMIPVHGLHGTAPEFMLEGVPDTISPVKARLGYAQVLDGDDVVLRPTWKVIHSHAKRY